MLTWSTDPTTNHVGLLCSLKVDVRKELSRGGGGDENKENTKFNSVIIVFILFILFIRPLYLFSSLLLL